MPSSLQNQLLIPQAYLTNFHNRIRNDDVPMFVSAQPTRGHKRAKVVNYAEFDNDLFDDFTNGGSTMPGIDGPTGSINDQNETGENGEHQESAEDKLLNAALPDIQDQEEQISILKYPKIRETFLQSKVATPYRLNVNETTSAGNNEPIIIPIHLDVEYSGHTIHDSFTWNINDHSITPEEFATIYCKDLDFFNATTLHSQIVSTINEQIHEYETVAAVVVPDLHVIINLTCSLKNKLYEDNFQWNLNDNSLTPEMFASIIVSDLGLTREFIPTISYALHDYLLKVKKDWLEGHLNQDHVPNGAASVSYTHLDVYKRQIYDILSI